MNTTKIRTGVFVVAIFLCLVAAPVKADWDPGDGYKMLSPQLPDPEGWDVASYQYFISVEPPLHLADDWLCTETGPVTDIHIWGSWKNDNKGEIFHFDVSIWSNDNGTNFSHPGVQLWQHDFYGSEFTERNWSYDYGSYPQGWLGYIFNPSAYPPVNKDGPLPGDHLQMWQYNLHINNPAEAFVQEQGTTYWLVIAAWVINPGTYQFGWKTSLNNWEDTFVVETLPLITTPDKEGIWYNDPDRPPGSTESLAFVIAGSPLLSCGCGDICVNETGWWRNGSYFSASGTPIQAAVDNASAGDTICVKDGNYTENVVVDVNNLWIRSQNGPANCIVNALNTSNAVLEVSFVNWVSISGFTIQNAANDDGVCLNTAHNCTISGNTILNNSNGIRLIGPSNYNNLTDNTVSNNNYGIVLVSGNYNNLTDNTVSNNNDGIALSFSSNNNITCNWVHSNTEYGFFIVSSNYGQSTGNTIESNNIMDNGYNFYNQQPQNVEAKYNYWGTDNETLINASIYDYYDDSNLGIVNFSGYIHEPADCAPIPEAATILMFSAGLLALAGYTGVQRRRSRK